jgi:hypothetical protein
VIEQAIEFIRHRGIINYGYNPDTGKIVNRNSIKALTENVKNNDFQAGATRTGMSFISFRLNGMCVIDALCVSVQPGASFIPISREVNYSSGKKPEG